MSEPDQRLLEPRTVSNVTQIADGWVFNYQPCNHEVWTAINPSKHPPTPCAQCLEVYIEQCRNRQQEEPYR